MAPVLEVQDLSTHIKLTSSVVQAVGNVDFQVEAGESLGIVGESGCGKSMTGLSIMGLLPPGGSIVSGSIKLDGRELVGLKDEEMRQIRGNEVAMIFQDPLTSLDPTKTIGYQVAEPVRLHRQASRAEALHRAVEVLTLVGLPRPKERLGDYPHQLSGGLRQRVMIAMALACEPKLLIADEPTTALDVTIQAQILALLRDLKDRLGMGMLLITHDMGVIAGHADRVNVMYAGRVVEVAEVGQLFAEMHHPYTQALLASIPQLDQEASKALHAIPGLPPDLSHPPEGCRFAARCSRATDKCRTDEPSLAAGKTLEHRFSCWHPVDGPLALSLIGLSGPDAASTGLAAPDAESMAEATPPPGQGGYTPELVADAPLAEAAEADTVVAEPAAESGPAGAHEESGRPLVVAAGLEVSADGGIEVTERAVEAAPADGNGLAPLLELRNLVKEYPITSGAILQRNVASVKAVSGVSFSVPAGTTFGLVGESGCGKTTIGKIIVALEKPNSGSVTLGDVDVSKLRGTELRRKRRDLQLMFQDPHASLDPRMRVGAIIGEPLAIQRLGSKRAQRDRVFELLGEVGLPRNAVERYPHEFSGGQRQRIGLARALTLNPGLIVADEPVSALDVSIRAQVLNLMKRLQALHGLTYVVISHDLAVVKYMAERIGVMYLGKLVELGSAQDIYESAAHPYTAGLIATIPVPQPAVERAKTGAAIRGELPSPVNPPSGCRFRTRCQFAQEICAAEEPQLRSFGPGHVAACHFPLQTPDGSAVSTPAVTTKDGHETLTLPLSRSGPMGPRAWPGRRYPRLSLAPRADDVDTPFMGGSAADTPATPEYLRASDEERDRAISALRQEFVEGRLSHETFMFRMQSALGARQRGQLTGLFTDLPPRRARLLDRVRAAFRRRDRNPDGVADWSPGPPPAPIGTRVPPGVADVSAWPPQSAAWIGVPGGPGGPGGPGENGRPAPMVFPPGSGTSFTIGRTQDCDLRVADMSVSRRHAQLDRGEDGWLLSDLGSHNGTRVNGWLVREPVPVRPGDLLQFGSAMFVIRDDTPAPAPPE